MTEYRRVYEALGLAPVTLSIFQGEIVMPVYAETPPNNYGFPPALIPIWSRDNPLYVGYWKHWFTSRGTAIVRMYIDGGRRVAEVARNSEQLVDGVLLESITAEEEIGPRSRSFAEAAGVSQGELERIDAISMDSGDEFSGLAGLDVYVMDPPAQLVSESTRALTYRGDFPRFNGEAELQQVCGTEVPLELRARLSRGEGAPPWLRASDQLPVFDRLIESGDFSGAWLSLNSPGWSFANAKDAASRLLARAVDEALAPEGFAAHIEAWLAQPHERAGSF